MWPLRIIKEGKIVDALKVQPEVLLEGCLSEYRIALENKAAYSFCSCESGKPDTVIAIVII